MNVAIVRPFTRRSLLWLAVLFGFSALLVQVTWYIVPWSVTKLMAPGAIKNAHATYSDSCGPKDLATMVAGPMTIENPASIALIKCRANVREAVR